jgi:hypothetical protein
LHGPSVRNAVGRQIGLKGVKDIGGCFQGDHLTLRTGVCDGDARHANIRTDINAIVVRLDVAATEFQKNRLEFVN